MSEQLVTVGDHQIILDTDEDDIVTDVLVLARIMRMEDRAGSSGLVVGASEGVDEIVQRGMLNLAESLLEWGCTCEGENE